MTNFNYLIFVIFLAFSVKVHLKKKMKTISVQPLNFNFQLYFLNLDFGTNYCYYMQFKS